MVQKSLELVRADFIKLGFLNGQYFVKSCSNDAPHKVSVTEKNIKCDQAYPWYRDNFYCNHALSVAIIENAIHWYAQSLSRIVKPNLIAIASKNVGRNVGNKKPVKERKRTKVSTREKVSVKYNNIQSFGSNNPVGLQREPSIPPTFEPHPISRFSHTTSNTCFQLTAQTSSSPNLLLNVQRSSDQPFALSFCDSTYDQLLTPAASDNAYQIPSTATKSTSFFNRCSVPQVRFNNDQNLLRKHQNIFTDTKRNLDANQVALTLLQPCDNGLSKCYGCQWPLKNGDGFPFPPPCDVRKDGILCEAPPSNVYFHVFHENPFVSPGGSENIKTIISRGSF